MCAGVRACVYMYVPVCIYFYMYVPVYIFSFFPASAYTPSLVVVAGVMCMLVIVVFDLVVSKFLKTPAVSFVVSSTLVAFFRSLSAQGRLRTR